MAKVIFGANLKMMNPVPRRSSSFKKLEALLKDYKKHRISNNEKREVIVFAPYTHLAFLRDVIQRKSLNLSLGAQGVSEHVSGAHTSGISPVFLKELGVGYVLVGHSEVRGEYEELIKDRSGFGNLVDPVFSEFKFNGQIKNAFQHGLNVVYCVGETLDEKEHNHTRSILERQIKLGLNHLNQQNLTNRLIIAYEPRWAIGKGKTPTPDEIRCANRLIRMYAQSIGHPDASSLPIIYGGSMNPSNVKEIMDIEGVNGGLVGGACLDAKKFAQVVNYRASR